MKVCIVSDSHDNRELLKEAGADAHARGAEAILHCGDLVAPSTLSVLLEFKIPIHVINGNNTGDMHTMYRMASKPDNHIHFYGQDADIRLGGRKIFIVHYPHYAEAMATTGDWDLVCYGHNHKTSITSVANIKGKTTLLINPGTVGGIGAPATYVFGNLETMEFDEVVIGSLSELDQKQARFTI